MSLLSEPKRAGERIRLTPLSRPALGAQRGWGTLSPRPPGDWKEAGRGEQSLEDSAPHRNTCWVGGQLPTHGFSTCSPHRSEIRFLRLLFLCCDVVVDSIFRGGALKCEGIYGSGVTQAGALLWVTQELGPGWRVFWGS